jgi:hypothetical protein
MAPLIIFIFIFCINNQAINNNNNNVNENDKTKIWTMHTQYINAHIYIYNRIYFFTRNINR